MDRGQTFGTWVSPGEHVLILVFILAGLIFFGVSGVWGVQGARGRNGMGWGWVFFSFFLLFFFSCSFLIFNFCDSVRYQQGYLGVRGMWKLLS